MRLVNFTTKKFKREKWLLVCETKSRKYISQIIICIINSTSESQIVKPNQYITLKRDIAKEKKVVVHNQATIYKQNRIPPSTNKIHNQ